MGDWAEVRGIWDGPRVGRVAHMAFPCTRWGVLPYVRGVDVYANERCRGMARGDCVGGWTVGRWRKHLLRDSGTGVSVVGWHGARPPVYVVLVLSKLPVWRGPHGMPGSRAGVVANSTLVVGVVVQWWSRVGACPRHGRAVPWWGRAMRVGELCLLDTAQLQPALTRTLATWATGGGAVWASCPGVVCVGANTRTRIGSLCLGSLWASRTNTGLLLGRGDLPGVGELVVAEVAVSVGLCEPLWVRVLGGWIRGTSLGCVHGLVGATGISAGLDGQGLCWPTTDPPASNPSQARKGQPSPRVPSGVVGWARHCTAPPCPQPIRSVGVG